MRIILGSSSRWRKRILEKSGYSFFTMSPNVDEKKIRSKNPKELVLKLANLKADALIDKISKPSLLISGDQVVVWNNQIREKPISIEQAKEFLKGYAKYPAETVSALVVVNTANGKRVSGIDKAKVHFKQIPEEVINLLIQDGKIFSCAGGFQLSDKHLLPYVEKIEGTVDSVEGLPLKLLDKLINLIN